MYEPKADWDGGAAGSSWKWPSMDVYGVSDVAKTEIFIRPAKKKPIEVIWKVALLSKSVEYYKMVRKALAFNIINSFFFQA